MIEFPELDGIESGCGTDSAMLNIGKYGFFLKWTEISAHGATRQLPGIIQYLKILGSHTQVKQPGPEMPGSG